MFTNILKQVQGQAPYFSIFLMLSFGTIFEQIIITATAYETTQFRRKDEK